MTHARPESPPGLRFDTPEQEAFLALWRTYVWRTELSAQSFPNCRCMDLAA